MRVAFALLCLGCQLTCILGHLSPFDFLEHEKAIVKRGRSDC